MASPKGYRRSDKLIRLLYSMSRTSLSFCFFHIKHRSGKRKPLLLLVVILLNHVSKTALFFPFLSICHFLFRDAEIPHRRKPKFDNAPAPRCSLRELLFFFSFSISLRTEQNNRENPEKDGGGKKLAYPVRFCPRM